VHNFFSQGERVFARAFALAKKRASGARWARLYHKATAPDYAKTRISSILLHCRKFLERVARAKNFLRHVATVNTASMRHADGARRAYPQN